MSLDAATVADVEERAAATVARHRLPGLALGLVDAGGLTWSAGYGLQSLDSSKRPDEHTIARVASVTKTFTTTAILQLRDEGRLHLDDPLQDHLPEFAQARERGGSVAAVTLRRLLTHRAGLVTESPVRGWSALSFPSMEEILEALPRTDVVLRADAAWKYSNLGFALLGEVVHRLSGTAYGDYLRQHILDPLEMPSTVLDLTPQLRPRFFTGYDPPLFQDRPRPAAYAHLDGVSAAGQLHSTVADLARWVAFQFRGDGGSRQGPQVLDGCTLTEMHRPQFLDPDWSAGQCLGWRATRVGDRVYHNHGGGIHGFSTQVWFDLVSCTGAITLVNMWPPAAGLSLARDVLESVLGARRAAPEPPAFEAAPAEWERFLGAYRAAPGIDVRVEFRAGQLRLAPPPGATSLHAPAALEPTGDDGEWRVVGGRGAGETAAFEFDDAGRVLAYTLGGFRFEKYSLPERR